MRYGIVEGWLARAKQSSDLMVVSLTDEQRAVHVPRLVEEPALRLSKSSAAMNGWDAAMLVDEARILEMTIFGMLQSNLHSLDVTLLLPDVMAIADGVDAQLTQSVDGYTRLMKATSAA